MYSLARRRDIAILEIDTGAQDDRKHIFTFDKKVTSELQITGPLWREFTANLWIPFT